MATLIQVSVRSEPQTIQPPTTKEGVKILLGHPDVRVLTGEGGAGWWVQRGGPHALTRAYNLRATRWSSHELFGPVLYMSAAEMAAMEP